MTPSIANSLINPVSGYPKFSRPLGHREAFPIQSDSDVLPRIVLLGLVSCPAAVVLGVIRRAVNSVEAKSIRAIAHVGKKRFERFPRRVISDAASTVARVVLLLRVIASFFHPAPRVVGHRVRHAVGSVPLHCDLNLKTTARLGMPALELPGLRRCAASTFAGTVPLASAEIGDRCQAGEARSCDVDEFHESDYHSKSLRWGQ